MIIDCISDLHGYYPKLEGGDLLIVGGDLTARDTQTEYFRCFDWIHEQNYRKKILIAGNHDNEIQKQNYKGPIEKDFDYLSDSGTEFEGFKIWGSPWTKTFPGMNPHCKAFTFDTEDELAEKWALIPDDIDILITHGPPFDILDETDSGERVGSKSLLVRILQVKPRIHVFGHIHEQGGKLLKVAPSIDRAITFVNASHVNEYYKPVNKVVRIEL